MPDVPVHNAESDIGQIRRLLSTYARGVDSKDWILWRSVFTRDATIDHTGLTGVVGSPETTSAALESGLATTETTLHYITNTEVDLRGDTAQVHALYLAVVKFIGVESPLYSGGTYWHDVLRTAQGWRSRELVVTPVWFDQRQP